MNNVLEVKPGSSEPTVRSGSPGSSWRSQMEIGRWKVLEECPKDPRSEEQRIGWRKKPNCGARSTKTSVDPTLSSRAAWTAGCPGPAPPHQLTVGHRLPHRCKLDEGGQRLQTFIRKPSEGNTRGSQVINCLSPEVGIWMPCHSTHHMKPPFSEKCSISQKTSFYTHASKEYHLQDIYTQ